MSNGAVLIGWPQREREVVASLQACPLPDGCGGRFLGYDFATGKFNGNREAAFGAPCPFYSSACTLGRVERKKRALAICDRICHAEFLSADATGGDILNPRASKALELIAHANRQIVILASGTGRGKDFAIASRLVADEVPARSVHWLTASELVRDMASGCKRFNASLHKGAVCVVEDLGTEPAMAAYGQGESAALIGEALAKWIGTGAKIYISANIGIETMVEQYGKRAASRLRGLSDYLEISDNEPDFRLYERGQ
jgi:hypothetical protein